MKKQTLKRKNSKQEKFILHEVKTKQIVCVYSLLMHIDF